MNELSADELDDFGKLVTTSPDRVDFPTFVNAFVFSGGKFHMIYKGIISEMPTGEIVGKDNT